MAILKQSTTYTRTFLLVESSDHVTGLTGATATVNLSKAGGTFAAAGGTITEVANGWYKIALTTTDTNTLGDLAYHITATSADPTDFVDQVCANILGDTLPADAQKINGVSTSSVATINANLGTTQPLNFTGTSTSALVKSDMQDVAGAPVSTSTAQLGVNVVNWKGSAAPANTGDAYARLGAPVGASISADIAALKTDLDGGVTVTTNSDKTGYSLTQTFPANFSSLAIDVSGDVTYNNSAPPSSSSIASAVLTTQMSESYAVKGTVPTLAQLLFEVRALQAEKSVNTITLTAKKIDGTTSAATYTLNDATAPTSITRAT